MRTLIGLSFVTTFLFITIFSASAALDPNLILYFTFDEQLDGRKVEDMTGGGNNGKLRFGATITNEPAEVYTGTGALKIFNNISAQFRVDSFDRMDKYNDHTYIFWLYVLEPLIASPPRPPNSVLKKANILVGDEKGDSPGISLTDLGLSLVYKFGRIGPDAIGPGGAGVGFDQRKWYHIAGVKQSSNLIVYINGEAKGKFNVQRGFVQGRGHLRIGGTTSRAAFFVMDEFQLYDRALTKKEVELDSKGQLLSVDPKRKLTTTWSNIKIVR
jgi:hypothetical protein